MIAYSTERKPVNTPGGVLGEYMTEEVPGQHCGTITYTMGGRQNDNCVDIPLWAPGHGHGFRTLNLLHKQACTTAERLSYTPNFMQRIWDTDLNKEVICVDESKPLWVDAMGNLVDEKTKEKTCVAPVEILKIKRNSGFSSSPKVPYKQKSTHENFVSA